MNLRVRRGLGLLVVWVLLAPAWLAMSGFARQQSTFAITGDGEVQITYDTGVLKSHVQEQNQTTTPQELCALVDVSKMRNASAVPYDDGTYIGCRINGLAKVGDVTNPSITEADGVWTFTMTPPADSPPYTDFEISVNFPGEVLSHNGSSTVSGRTVTWTNPADLTSGPGLVATGRATGAITPAVAAIAIAALLGVGAVVWVALWARQRRRARASEPDQAGVEPGEQWSDVAG